MGRQEQNINFIPENEAKKPFGRPRYRWQITIEIHLKEP
jgi:hypothetical protein